MESVELSCSSGSDDLSETYKSSAASSVGRSSISSIPWAEDAIRQNFLDWMQIERIFYGEEELPTDLKLREEILDWTKRFPHLRLIGTKAAIHFTNDWEPEDEIDEVIAIHPELSHRRCSESSIEIISDIEDWNLDKCKQVSPVRQTNSAFAELSNRITVEVPFPSERGSIFNTDPDRCLRIPSGTLLSRRLPYLKQKAQKKKAFDVIDDKLNINCTDRFMKPSTSCAGLIIRQSKLFVPEINKKCNQPKELVKMPPIQSRPMNIGDNLKKPPPLKNSVTLPSINFNKDMKFRSPISTARSISALTQDHHLSRNLGRIRRKVP